ncbi:MAG: four helix bundle protein [Paludibacteraceae bacterium]|nr:four helix bundle protein [Paludibacteraceae bacterium]
MDFIHKLAMSQEECNETLSWLELLYETHYLTKEQFDSLYTDAEEIMHMLSSSIITMRKKT